jgi:hypothetical protein
VPELVYGADLKSAAHLRLRVRVPPGSLIINFMKQKQITYQINKKGCWICTSHSTNKNGYCKIQINKVQTFVHRHLYQIHREKLDKNTILRHICDNPQCINPDHLIKGTHKENVQDRVDRKRSAYGISNGRSKLTEEQVKEIKYNSLYKKQKELSLLYNVSSKVIYNIQNNLSWTHL